MKKLFAILLAVLMLCTGCAKPVQPQTTTAGETTVPVTTEPLTQPTEPEIKGLYTPDSDVELQTKGAVREYAMPTESFLSITAVDGSLMLISADAVETTMTLYTGDHLEEGQSLKVQGQLGTEAKMYLADDQGIAYYDKADNCVVFCNTMLQENGRITLPRQLDNTPKIGQNRELIFYASGDSVYELNVRTGIERLVVRRDCQWINVENVIWDDKVLAVFTEVDDQTWYYDYILTETGETVYSGDQIAWIDSDHDRYCARVNQEFLPRFVFGTDEKFQEVDGGSLQESAISLINMNGIINVENTDTGTKAEFLNLGSGRMESALSMEGVRYTWNYTGDPQNNRIYFLGYDSEDKIHIYRWDLDRSRVSSERNYVMPHYSRENPDVQGLAALEKEIQVLEEKYGVDIVIGEEAGELYPWDYVFVSEYRVPFFRKALKLLDQCMSRYPEGVLAQSAEQSDTGKLHICLVQEINGSVEGTLHGLLGLQYWLGNEVYMAMSLGGFFEQTFYHELFHVMDSRILSNSSAYDEWYTLNPEGFDYDYDYVLNNDRDENLYLWGEDRYFVDTYSMSFPGEDRARLMEYAMMPYNDDVFESEHMQAKLKTLSLGIREVYGLEDWDKVLPWETYLKESLVPEN